MFIVVQDQLAGNKPGRNNYDVFFWELDPSFK